MTVNNLKGFTLTTSLLQLQLHVLGSILVFSPCDFEALFYSILIVFVINNLLGNIICGIMTSMSGVLRDMFILFMYVCHFASLSRFYVTCL